jgi:hypothetical protein
MPCRGTKRERDLRVAKTRRGEKEGKSNIFDLLGISRNAPGHGILRLMDGLDGWDSRHAARSSFNGRRSMA